MNDLIINEELNQLFSLYKTLLTPTQQEYFIYYYQKNYTFQEIANLLNVSRNAIYDQLEKTKARLYELESKLELYKKRINLVKIINEVKNTENVNLLDELLEEGERND